MSAEPYDLELVYDEQIAPLMTQIIAICKANQMPMVASFAYACDGAGDGDYRLCTSSVPRPGQTPRSFSAFARGIVEPQAALIAVTITKRGGPDS